MNLKKIIEAILFKSVKPLSAADLVQTIRRAEKNAEEAGEPMEDLLTKVTLKDVISAIDEIKDELAERPVMMQEVAGGYRLVTRPEYEAYVAPLAGTPRQARLSQPALETLAVIAYRQPLSRAEIEAVRGVAVGGVLETLVDRGIIEVAGRADVPGRPLIYETTPYFLQHFGLNSLDELPNIEELKRVQLPETSEASEQDQPELIDDLTANTQEN